MPRFRQYKNLALKEKNAKGTDLLKHRSDGASYQSSSVKNRSLRSLFSVEDYVSHEDIFGPDPFHFRAITNNPFKLTDKHTLTEIIKQLCLTNIDDASSIFRPEHDTSPLDTVHFIWLGSALDDDSMKMHINSWQKHNPKKRVIVWTDQITVSNLEQDLDEAPKYAMHYWAQQHEIILLSIQDVVYGNISEDLERLIKAALLKPNYAMASDVLRIWLLIRFGGIYSDIDIKCVAAIEPRKMPKGLLLNKGGRRWGDIYTTNLNNDLIFALPGNQILKGFLDQIIKNSRSSIEDLFHHNGWTYDDKKKPQRYNRFSYLHTYHGNQEFIYRQRTQLGAGPTAFHQYMKRVRKRFV